MASISPTARSREAAACPAFPSTQLRAELQSVATQRRALAWPFLGPSPERTKKKVQERHRLNTGRKPSPIPTKEEHSPHHPVGGKKILDLPSPHPPPLPSLLSLPFFFPFPPFFLLYIFPILQWELTKHIFSIREKEITQSWGDFEE